MWRSIVQPDRPQMAQEHYMLDT